MNEPFACTLAIIFLTSLCSIVGFSKPGFRDRYLFSVREILAEKQLDRLFTSAFLHADWSHLFLNMVTLYLFGRHLERFLGLWRFLLIYFAAILGGSLLSLLIHRHHDYKAYGASGGVSGMMFSYILLFPGASIVMFPLPLSIPSWLYAILFFVGSFVALKGQADNVGHDAHLGGAVIGLWSTAALEPWIVRMQSKLFVTISVLSILLFVYLARNPLCLPLANFLPRWPRQKPRPSRRPPSRHPEMDVDAILEKISKRGIDSLTVEERALLNSASKTYQRRAGSNKSKSDLIL